ncbi:MAG: amino acid adenylation domain-containing protein [Cyanobacteria bacterium P01_H01_bin.15]
MTTLPASAITSLRQRIKQLSPPQQQQLRQQLAAKGIDWQTVVGEDFAEETTPQLPERLPLSPAQQHLWVVQQLYPETTAYHISTALELSGALNIPALIQSLQKIVERHETLRTVFVASEGQAPEQKVLPDLTLTVPTADLRDATNPEEIELWRQRIAHERFDLSTGPLIRAQLLQLAPERHELVLVFHHLIADGWSRGILLRELTNFYRHYSCSESLSLPPLTLQYPDYVLRTQVHRDSPQQQRNLEYWRGQLQDLPTLDLPCDRKSQTADYASHTLTRFISPEQTQTLKALAQQLGVSLFVLLLTTFKLLLHRYTAQRDLAVGIPVAGRNSAAAEKLIGFFVNTLVLRSQIEGTPTFQDYVAQVQRQLAEALSHEVSLPEVMEALDLPRTPGQNPLFRVMFQVQSGYQLQNAAEMGLDLPGLTIKQHWIPLKETKFDQSWHLLERDGGLLLGVEYRTALFDCDRIERMLDHFHVLMDQVPANPRQSIAKISLLSEAGRSQILAWSPGPTAQPFSAGSFPERFEAQVAQTPNAIAVRSESETYTYQQLNQEANQLARWLNAQKIGREDLVGVCLKPGWHLIVALLAILKSGAAYLPLDPSLPSGRLSYLLEDGAPKVLITQSELESLTQDFTETRLSLDAAAILADYSEENFAFTIEPTQLAYIIYTSGSTGNPKGTLLTHGGLINYLNWCVTAYPIKNGEGVPVQSSVGFDATITSLFSPLLTGQTLIVEKGPTEIEALQQAILDDVSIVKLTPAHLQALQPLLTSETLNPDKLPSGFIIGGEALYAHHLSVWREYKTLQLINEYGPTEAVVGCCVHRVEPGDRGNLPIGRPISGVQLYVLDEYLEPVPIGVPGELYIGGAGVARGYLHQSALTADRFVPNPFGNKTTSTVLYRTGDWVCYCADGVLSYLGRRDQQVSVRGFRIELGEIEGVLTAQSEIEQAVVTLYETEKRTELVGYLVTQVSESAFTDWTETLRDHIAGQLPSYMIPQQFIRLDQLPLTINGKVNRSQLPAPPSVASEGTRPQTEKELILQQIWQEILQRSEIGIHDNFFELGGDSISAMQIVSRAQQQGLQLTPAQLFEHQTISGQAAIAKQKSATVNNAVVTGDAPLGPIQRHLLTQDLPEPHHYNQSVMLEVTDSVDAQVLGAALKQLVHHHDALRLRFCRINEQWTQTYLAPDAVDVPLDLLNSTDTDVDSNTLQFQRSLNLEDGPLFRAALITAEAQTRLLLVAHHLIVDGLSWRIILEDLNTLYRQLTHQETPKLPVKTTTFGDWTRHLQAQDFSRDRSFWQRVCEPVPELPVELPKRSTTPVEAVVSLNPDQTQQLQKQARTQNVLMLTALAQTLTQWSRQQTVVVDLEGHGRRVWSDEINISRTVGWFTALYPVRLTLATGSIEEQLNQATRQLEVPHDGISFGALNGQGANLKSPAQVSWNYLGLLSWGEQTGQLITGFVPKPVIGMRSPANPNPYDLEVIALLCPHATTTPSLDIRWRSETYADSTLALLAQRYLNNLKSLLAYVQQPKQTVPSNFSVSRVDGAQLNQLMTKLKGRR